MSPGKQADNSGGKLTAVRKPTSSILQTGRDGSNPPLARKVKGSTTKTTTSKRKEATRESIAEIIEKARQTEAECNMQQGGDGQVDLEEATNIANQANNQLKPVKFIGQFENVSKWIPRSCSVYAESTNLPEERK